MIPNHYILKKTNIMVKNIYHIVVYVV